MTKIQPYQPPQSIQPLEPMNSFLSGWQSEEIQEEIVDLNLLGTPDRIQRRTIRRESEQREPVAAPPELLPPDASGGREAFKAWLWFCSFLAACGILIAAPIVVSNIQACSRQGVTYGK